MLKKYNDFITEKASVKTEILNEGVFGDMFQKFWNFLLKKFGKKTWLKYVMFLNEHDKLDPKKIEIYDGDKEITNIDNDVKKLEDEFEDIEDYKEQSSQAESQPQLVQDEPESTQGESQIVQDKEDVKKMENIKNFKDFILNEDQSTLESENIYIPNATMGEIKDFIESGYKMRIEDPTDTLDPLFIWGAPGIGKTEGVHQFCKENNLLLIVWHLATVQAVDFVGVPTVVDRKTIFNIPAIFPEEGSIHKGGILFFDELNRAQPDVLSAALQICNDGHVGEYKLPDNWWVIAAGNRESDEPGRISELGSALSARFAHKNLVLNVKDWIEWAMSKNKLHEDILAFFAIKENGEKYFHYLDPDRGDHPWANPRNWVKVSKRYSRLLKSTNKTGDELNNLIRSDFSSIVGVDAAATFMAFLKIKEKFTPKDIEMVYTDPMNAKIFEKEQLDIGVAIMAYITFYKHGEELTENELENFLKYVDRYDNYELSYILMTYLIKVHPEITDSVKGAKYKKLWVPAFMKYGAKYKDFWKE